MESKHRGKKLHTTMSKQSASEKNMGENEFAGV